MKTLKSTQFIVFGFLFGALFVGCRDGELTIEIMKNPPCVDHCEVTCDEGEMKTPTGCMTCDDVTYHVMDEIENTAPEYAGCHKDSDCTWIMAPVDCVDSYSVVVSQPYLDAFEEEMRALSATYCDESGYWEHCGGVTVDGLLPNPVCENGQCVGNYDDYE